MARGAYNRERKVARSACVVTLLLDLLLGDLLLVLLKIDWVHLLEGVGGRVVGLVDDRVVLLVALDDALRGGAVDDRRAARRVDVMLEYVRV